MEPTPKPRRGKRLLVAAIGVATVSYAGTQNAGCNERTTSGNLIAPPPFHDAGLDADVTDAGTDALITSGNLIAPPPVDTGPDVCTSSNLLPLPPLDGGDAAIADGGEDGACGDGATGDAAADADIASDDAGKGDSGKAEGFKIEDLLPFPWPPDNDAGLP